MSAEREKELRAAAKAISEAEWKDRADLRRLILAELVRVDAAARDQCADIAEESGIAAEKRWKDEPDWRLRAPVWRRVVAQGGRGGQQPGKLCRELTWYAAPRAPDRGKVMDSRSGELYSTRQDALAAGVPERDLVMLDGPPPAIKRVARKVRMQSRHEATRRRAKRKAQKDSRKRNKR